MLNFLFVTFALGTIWWYIVTITFFVIMFTCVEKENSFFSALWLILYLAFLQFIVKADFLGSITHNPIKVLLYVLGYLVIGFLWSFVKWWLYVDKKADQLKKNRAKYLSNQKQSLTNYVTTWSERIGSGSGFRASQTEDLEKTKKLLDAVNDLGTITEDTPVPDALRADWKSSSGYEIPKATEHKSKISIWVVYWPVSLVWSLVNDFVKKFIRTLITQFRVVYDNITKMAYHKIEKI